MSKHVVYFRFRDGKPSFGEKAHAIKQQRLPAPSSFRVHEARNPVCHIDLACDLLNLCDLDEEQRKCVDIIVRNSERINDFINGLLGSEANKQFTDIA
jgi:nitrogen-specific signal transduction histidine kinase